MSYFRNQTSLFKNRQLYLP